MGFRYFLGFFGIGVFIIILWGIITNPPINKDLDSLDIPQSNKIGLEIIQA